MRLSPEQQEAERTARWLRENPSVRREASVDERVQAIQWEWVSGSNRRAAVVLKEATKREFALEGDVWSRGIPYRLPDSDVEQARTDARAMFERTQAHFAEAGVKRVRLYRGLKPGSAPHRNSIESWTSDPNVARRFAGPGGVVLQQDFPVQQILTHHGVPGWIDGPYGSQAEYLVMR